MRRSGDVSLVESVLGETLPMYGRMIHGRSKTGELEEQSQQYDVHGKAIHAVDRAGLNKRLLNALEPMPNVTFFFNHKLTGADFKKNKAWFEQTASKHDGARRAPEIEVSFDLIIGADGAHSAARYHLMKYARVNYMQEYIDTLWCEFQIAPTATDSFALSPHHLHIWPGQEFMFIAIPSLDKSFTCTLFAPHSTFARLVADQSSLPAFFDQHFPGVSPQHIPRDELIRQFSDNPHLPLISIKCAPYHYAASVVILGDAAHAMVPFYGQGMNAGLEDVRVLFEQLDLSGVYDADLAADFRAQRREAALDAYTKLRAPDASAINDLALRNYHEMRSGVTSPVYLFRKHVEEFVSKYLPSLGWATQYSRVSFGNQRYSEVIEAVRRQGQILLGMSALLAVMGLSGPLAYWVRKGGVARLREILSMAVGRARGLVKR
jgi:kynurenine 3-monooxygenase